LFHKKTSANQADVILQRYNPIRLDRFWIEVSWNLSVVERAAPFCAPLLCLCKASRKVVTWWY